MYNQIYNPQVTRERLDGEIARLQQMKEQIGQQQPSINQTFQLAPITSGMRFVNSIEDVKKEMVYIDTPYFSNDMSVLWVKNSKGDIKAFELKEIVKKDEKDLIIENLQIQLDEMKEMIKNATTNNAITTKPDEEEQSANVPSSRTSKKK